PDDIIVNTYFTKAGGNTWGSIPVVNGNLTDDRTVNSLSSDFHIPENYTGDICKYLSDNRSTSGLVSEWRMPTSDKFAGSGNQLMLPYESDGSIWDPQDWDGTGTFDGEQKENGASQTADAFMVYTLPTGETVYFPASGFRHDSNSELIGVGGNGYYWSSSASTGNAYSLYISSGLMHPNSSNVRTSGRSVRCVRL
ncbi:MAG: fibrobacter succinogenes major paralogous domain-containing protein, partial [Prevotella sp.]|nr:fibrobacter succinogenes major paralogous domain-containing protein [Prevotella sp.]